MIAPHEYTDHQVHFEDCAACTRTSPCAEAKRILGLQLELGLAPASQHPPIWSSP